MLLNIPLENATGFDSLVFYLTCKILTQQEMEELEHLTEQKDVY